MTAPFLSGLFAAWTITQLGFGAFFVLAHSLRRPEREYLLFGLVCFALALDTAGIALNYALVDPADWPRAAALAHVGAIAAASLNLHFVLHYVGIRSTRRVMRPVYAATAFFIVANLSGAWWVPGSLDVSDGVFLGVSIAHARATPSLIAIVFYVVAVAIMLASLALLVQAFRRGKREAGIAIGAAGLIAGAVVNDVLLVTGSASTVYLTPAAFVVYAFAVGSTLLFRYRSTAGELEVAVDDLRQRTSELRTSYAELRSVQDELGRKRQLAAVGELAAMIAHEVRNPLAVIINAAASLKRPGLGEDDRSMLLGIVEEETARLNRLVTDLLRFARPVDVKRSPVFLAELARRSAPRADGAHGFELEADAAAASQTISADPALLRLVFDNLISNACQAMPAGGAIHVSVRESGRGAERGFLVEVADTGEGMEDEVLSRAPDPFFTTRPSGTGLGLPIVERIIEAHGGTFTIDSAAGRGTTVRIFLPFAGAEAPRAEPERQSA